MTWRFAVCSLCLVVAPAAFACSMSASDSAPGSGAGGDDDSDTDVGTSGSTTGMGEGGGGGTSGQGAAGGAGIGGTGSECLTLCAQRHEEGAGIYGLLHTCVYCQACFVTCDGATLKCERPMRPSMCDVSQDCDGCKTCALEGECSKELADCDMAPDCLEYGNCIAACANQ